MEKATIIGLDIAKQVFQVHGINQAGAIVCRRRLRREDVVAFFKVSPPCRPGVPRSHALRSRSVCRLSSLARLLSGFFSQA